FEMTLENWESQFAINVTARMALMQQFARTNKYRGGCIINIASTAGLGPRPGRSAYAASKAALISLSRSVGEELRPYGIRVYTIALGPCNTDLRRRLFPDEDPERIMQPHEAASYLADLIEGGNLLAGQV